MSAPRVSIEAADVSFARTLSDIGYVLAFAEHPEQRIQRVLELLKGVVTYDCCAVLIDAPPERRFATVPVSSPAADRLHARLHRLLHTVSERTFEGIGVDAYQLPNMSSIGSWSLAVPLVAVDSIVGILQVERDSKEYALSDVRLLSLVASQLAAYARGLQFVDQAERARSEAEEAASAKDRFLATLSHELRTPLNVVQGWLQMLRTKAGDEAETLRAVAVIERNVDVQVQLVDQLLDAARIATGKFHIDIHPLEIVPVLNSTVDGVRPSATLKGIELECVVPSPGAWTIDGDATQLQRAFANLLVNAVKFTPAGGCVCVTLVQHGNHLAIAFRDTGIGIAPQNLSKIFEPLWQVEGASNVSESGGLGLGLSIVRHIVQLHDGEVLVESEGPGKGTTVTVRLPLRGDLSSEGTVGSDH